MSALDENIIDRLDLEHPGSVWLCLAGRWQIVAPAVCGSYPSARPASDPAAERLSSGPQRRATTPGPCSGTSTRPRTNRWRSPGDFPVADG